MTRTNIIYYTHNNNNFEALLGLLNLEYQRNNSLEVIINQTRYSLALLVLALGMQRERIVPRPARPLGCAGRAFLYSVALITTG